MIFLRGLARLAHISLVIIRHASMHIVLSRLVRSPALARRLGARSISGPERLRATIEDTGGTFIKFGQMLALQPDIIPLEYCNALFNLLDRVSPSPFEMIERTFIRELSKAPLEVFDSFERQPIATASIGQVHIAYLGDRKVAVKVQRPNVERDFAGDVRLMAATIRLIKYLRWKKFFWLIEPMSEFIAWTHEELDYRCEARYMQKARDNAWGNVHERVPEVIWEHTTRRILVLEYLEGVTVLDYLRALDAGDSVTLEKLAEIGFEPDRFASNIINNFVADAFRHGMFHADLHPANLMILPGNVVGYVDFGITAVLSRYSRHNLIALTLALSRGDLDGMCSPFFNVSAMDLDADPERFRDGLKTLDYEWYGLQGQQRELRVNVTRVMLDMIKLSRQTGIFPERDVVKYVRSSMAVDGLVARFAPGFNLGRHLEAICKHYVSWQERLALFSLDNLVEWSNSSGRLMRDGVFRAGKVLHVIATGEWPAHSEITQVNDQTESGLRDRAILLSVVILVVSLFITVTGERMTIGVNMFTAESLLLVTSVMMFLRTTLRLV